MHKYHNADLFKEMVEGMEEGGCVCTVWCTCLQPVHFSIFWHNKQYVRANWYKIHFHSLESIFSSME